MRAAIGEMELDEILHARAQLNTIIKSAVQEGATPWGLNVLRYEITEITPDKTISEAMDKQAAVRFNPCDALRCAPTWEPLDINHASTTRHPTWTCRRRSG